MNALLTKEAPTTPPSPREPRTTPHRPRERWAYLGRSVHYGHVYDVWVLKANPRLGHVIGRRYAVLIGDAG